MSPSAGLGAVELAGHRRRQGGHVHRDRDPFARREHQRDEVVRPVQDEHEQRRARERPEHHRQRHAREHPEPRAALDERGLLDLDGHVVEVGLHEPEREGQRDDAVDERQPPPRVDEPEERPHDHDRDHDGQRREEPELRQRERQVAARAEARQPVGGRGARDHGDERADDRGQQGGEDRAPRGALERDDQLVRALAEDEAEVVERGLARPPRQVRARRGPFRDGLERHRHHPGHRDQREQQRERDGREPEDLDADRAIHGSRPPPSRPGRAPSATPSC